MSTATVTDIAALVGEMEAVPCEHSQHGQNHGFEGQPASSYIRSDCPGCHAVNVYAGCQEVVLMARSEGWMHCDCGHLDHANVFLTILGPVNQ